MLIQSVGSGVRASSVSLHVVCGWIAPAIAINCLRAIHRLDSAHNVTTCAAFFANPRNLTFASPN